MIPRRWSIVVASLGVPAALACGSRGEPADEPPASMAARVPANHDPCHLLTREEAEQALGSLVAAPYRSQRDTSVAHPDGPTCTYPASDGRVFLVTPEWTYGKMTLDVERLVGGLVRQVADLPGVVADTLEGLWDDAVVGLAGELVLRKGARSLTIAYLHSSTDAAGAIRLSGPALTRLAAVPEPPRSAVASDGCPLAPAIVTNLVGLPVRLAPRPVRLIDSCSYTLEEDPTVEVELSIKPEESADFVFDGLHSRVKGLLGAAAVADTVTFGDGGWSYGSNSGSEAAVRAEGKVYHARMAYPLSTTTPAMQEAMVRLVAAMIG